MDRGEYYENADPDRDPTMLEATAELNELPDRKSESEQNLQARFFALFFFVEVERCSSVSLCQLTTTLPRGLFSIRCLVGTTSERKTTITALPLMTDPSGRQAKFVLQNDLTVTRLLSLAAPG